MVRRRRIAGADGAFYYCPIVTAMTRFREPPWPQACPPPSPLFGPREGVKGRVHLRPIASTPSGTALGGWCRTGLWQSGIRSE